MRPVPILMLLTVMGCFASCRSAPNPARKSSADAPVTKTRDATSAVRHVFRSQAMHRADSTRIYAMVATGIDPSVREELLHLVDEHEAKVNARTAQIQGTAPDLLNEAGRMSGEFAGASDNWFAKNPTAKSAINRAAALLDDTIDVLGNDRLRLLTAAEMAGLPDAKRKEARMVIEAQYDELLRAHREFEGRKQRSARAFETDPDFIEAPGLMADLVIDRLQIAKSLRDQLHDMLPAERRDQLDEEIGRLGRAISGGGSPFRGDVSKNKSAIANETGMPQIERMKVLARRPDEPHAGGHPHEEESVFARGCQSGGRATPG